MSTEGYEQGWLGKMRTAQPVLFVYHNIHYSQGENRPARDR